MPQVNRKFGWHAGTVTAWDMVLNNDFYIYGSLNFGDASADTLTINGTTQCNGTLTAGVDDAGYDVKFFGATSGSYWMWDESGDKMIIVGDSQLTGTLTVGVDDTGHDVKFFGATASSYLLWDESEDELVFSAATLQLGGKMKFALNGGAASVSGLLMGVGTSANPATTATVDANFMEFRTQSTATSGDSRGFYLRHNIHGIAGGGEAIRAFSKVTVAASTVRGAHISLDMDAAGTVSGFGAGVDAQLMLGAATYTNTLAALNLEVYGNASASVSGGSTSLIRAVLNGDGTAIADIDDNANFISFTGGSIASGNIVQAETDETKFSHKIRCDFNGTTMYLMACNS